MTLPKAILAAMPGTMKEVAARLGVGGPLLWDTARAMREAGILKSAGADGRGKLIYAAGDKPLPDGWEPGAPASSAAPAEEPQSAEERRRNKKWPAIVFWIDGWPDQDPGRVMLWSIVYRGERRAAQELRRLRRALKGEAQLEIRHITKNDAYRIRSRGFTFREVVRRERALREKAQTHS